MNERLYYSKDGNLQDDVDLGVVFLQLPAPFI
jgi:hypothetical protein